jgi:hypothetical protein
MAFSQGKGPMIGLFAVVFGLWLATPAAMASDVEVTARPADGIPRMCADAAEATRSLANLPFTSKAIRERKKIRVLALGATPLNERDQTKGHYSLVEQSLERTLKGLEVQILDYGVSGELADAGFARIRNQVALDQPDLLFWQVGVADALALTPPADFKKTLTETVKWLREHDVDVVLIGLRYQRALRKDPSYQKIRDAIREVIREQDILRIGHYEAIEALDRLKRQDGEPVTELDLTDAGTNCVADFLSRALAVGLFGKAGKGSPAAGKGEPSR